MLIYRKHKTRTQLHPLAEGAVEHGSNCKFFKDVLYLSCFGEDSSYFGLKISKEEALYLANQINQTFGVTPEKKPEVVNEDTYDSSAQRIPLADIKKLLG